MSETGSVPGKAGPEVSAAVEEVRGIFPSDSALQDAVSRLGVAGFDRADISIPGVAPLTQEATPEQGAENPNTAEDFSKRAPCTAAWPVPLAHSRRPGR